MSTHALHTRHETVVGQYVAAVLNQGLARLVEILSALGRLIVGPRFEATGREEFGADPQWPTDLRNIRIDLAMARQRGIDISGMLVATPLPTSMEDTLPRINDSLPLLAADDAADIAFRAGGGV